MKELWITQLIGMQKVNEVLISAVIKDSDENETYGNESETRIIIDEIAPEDSQLCDKFRCS